MFYGPGFWACGRRLIDTKSFFWAVSYYKVVFFAFVCEGERESLERRSIRNDWKWGLLKDV